MIYHGDEWRLPRLEHKIFKGRTREQEQSFIDTELCNGRMRLSDWRAKTDELSELTKWTQHGRVS